jgi:hypothetical protein
VTKCHWGRSVTLEQFDENPMVLLRMHEGNEATVPATWHIVNEIKVGPESLKLSPDIVSHEANVMKPFASTRHEPGHGTGFINRLKKLEARPIQKNVSPYLRGSDEASNLEGCL